MKIMAVDYGDSHTGLALSDITETLASPIGVIDDRRINVCAEKVAAKAAEHGAELIVVGNPLNMNNSAGPRSELCKSFAELLRKLVEVPVMMWDERSSTVTAHHMMNEVNRRGKKRRAVIDSVAAAVILENYLAWRANNKDN